MSVINAAPLLAAAGGDYQISRSVRLRLSATANFQRTYAAAPTTRTKQTISLWVKRGGSFGTSQGLFSGYDGSSSNANQITLDTNNSLRFDFGGSVANSLISTQVFRDPSAWYHFVVAVDTTQATASNRVLMYVNGVQITSFSSATYPALNGSTQWTLANANNRVGSSWDNGLPLDGYITEVHQIDGQALTPSSFGETDSVTGVWKPKKYTGTYGTNGFYLNFSDNSAATAAAIGKDYSGNGNNFTPNNISVTAGATYDSMLDVPTPYADGGNGRGNYCTLNPLSYDSTYTLSSANLNFSGARTSTATAYIRSTLGVSSGKWYWEVTPTDVGGGPNIVVGIQDVSTTATTGNVNSLLNGYGYGGDGYKNNNAGQTAGYGATYANGDVIGVALDLDGGTITFYKNNASQGVAYSSISGTYCPVISMSTAGVARTIAGSINCGQRPFTYTPPTGFKALNTQNLPDATIKKGNQYFDATTYTGTGASLAVVNSGAFQPDLVWTKSRSNTYSNHLEDAVRGVGLRLLSDSTADEVTGVNGKLTSFNSNGFTQDGGVEVGASAATYAAWQWNAGGNTVSNTSGSITSNVRANPTAGFSIVTYTGTGANATVGHGLGVAPKFIIARRRNNVVNWYCYHSALAAGNILLLNTTQTQTSVPTAFNSGTPTSTTFPLGADSTTNASGGLQLAYCFAEVAGFSKFGEWQNNNSNDGTFVYLGFRPRFVLLKSYDGAEQWFIQDSSRQPYNYGPGTTNYIVASGPTALAEGANSASNAAIDFLSNGFKIRSTNTAAGEISFGTRKYIYAAFAENPFKNSLAR